MSSCFVDCRSPSGRGPARRALSGPRPHWTIEVRPRGGGRPSRTQPSGSQLFGQQKGVGTPAPTGVGSQIETSSFPGKGRRSAEPGPQTRPAPRSGPGPPPLWPDRLCGIQGFPPE
ncbi:hypothetical protein NDU88_004725 [Pleurodeles waltl]|uniref:Uncharacterized protein n=1 Tax=Pleurodeles waltl TaxID=8319 RepID=A0AAV7UG05_PLEWA|nr:hypothetical protein NDU88_004725 [Pleurodeles waltl]